MMLSSFQSSSVLSSSRQRQQPRRTASVVVRCSADAERQKTGKAATVISATVGGVVLLPQAANAASKQTASVQAKAPPAKPEAKLVALPENVAQFLVFSQTIALVGAFVTGTRARQKRLELKAAVEKLRQVNEALRDAQKETRRQMKLVRDAQETCVTPDATAGEEEEKETVQFRPLLLAARSELTDGSAQKALQMFQEIELKASSANDLRAVRKAVRGCAAAKQRMSDFKGALEALKQSLRLGEMIGENEGDKETLGRIADLYAELNDFDNAGVYYDKYLAATGSDRGL